MNDWISLNEEGKKWAELAVPDFKRKTEIRNQLNVCAPNEVVGNKTRIGMNSFGE
jgi:hypothetical protein